MNAVGYFTLNQTRANILVMGSMLVIVAIGLTLAIRELFFGRSLTERQAIPILVLAMFMFGLFFGVLIAVD